MGDADEKPPEVPPKVVTYDMVRSSREGMGLGKPKVTESLLRATYEFRQELKRWLPVYDEYADQRPKTRGDCVAGARPCPWVSCSMNNYLDVKTSGGTAGMSIVYNFPDLLPEEVQPERSCALDIADRGGATLEDVAKLTNLTRERVRQVQAMALVNVEDLLEDAGVIEIDDDRPRAILQRSGERSLLSTRKNATEVEEETADDLSPDDLSLIDGDTLSFFSDNVHADKLISARVWRIYQRQSIEKGFVKRPKSERQKKLEAAGAEPLVDLPLPVAMTPRHNEVMATTKKKTKRNDDSHTRDSKVLNAYTLLKSKFGRVPNNAEIEENTLGITLSQIGSARKRLIESGLAKPAPRGKSPSVAIDDEVQKMVDKKKSKKKAKKSKQSVKPQSFGIRKSAPRSGGPAKIVEHQQLPDDAMQSAAEVLALPRGPLADAANAIRNEIITAEGQLTKLRAALHALGDLA